MNTKKRIRYTILTALAGLALSSCVSDVWEGHYQNKGTEVGELGLYDLMKSDPDLSIFCEMLEAVGYDTLLNASQTYTVWAPKNSALDTVTVTDTSEIGEIVRNHVARFNFSTAAFDSTLVKKIYMLSGKFIPFTKGTSDYTFGTLPLVSGNKLARNGLLYSIDGYVNYAPNIWEAIARTFGIDSVYQYLYSLGGIPGAQIDNEDSLYTAILPTNTAWNKAYDLIKGYYHYLPGTRDTSAQAQRRLTNSTILQDAFFKADISNPGAWVSDSLYSTGNHLIRNISDLFVGATKRTVSNGYIWLTDSMRVSPTDSWHREIKIEAENTVLGRTNTNSDVYWRSSENSGFDASGRRYIVVFPQTTSYTSKVAVTFPIPNTLSAKYNVYCVFIPSAIAENPALPCYVNFYMDYVNAAGRKLVSQSVAPKVRIDGTKVTKVFVKQMAFPFCNIFYGNNSDINVRLKVENEAKSTETNIYTRTMRIDCLILEPVH